MQSDPPSRLFRSESISQSLSVYLPATALSRAVGLARGLLLTWLMTQAQYGLLQIALLVVNLLNPLCSAGLNDSVQRYVPMHETRGTLRRFLRLAVPLVLVTGASSSVVVWVLARPVGGFLFNALRPDGVPAEVGAAVVLTRMAAVAAFGLIGFYLVLATLKGLRMYRAIGLIELTGNTAFAVLAVAVCWRGFNSAWLVIGGYAAVFVLLSAAVSGPLRRALARIESRSGEAAPLGLADVRAGYSTQAVVGQMLRFSLWSAPAAITWQVLLGYPMWYLNKAAGPATASVFAGVQLIAQGMIIVTNSVVTVVETAVTKTWESRGADQADRDLLLAHKATTLVLLAGGAVVAALAPLVLRILPASYAAGVRILPLLILFFLLAGHLLFFGIHFHLIERTRHLFAPWLLGVLGHVLFSMELIRHEMSPGAAQTAAAWAGIGGMSLALAGALTLVVIERRPTDRGLWILMAVGFALAAPASWMPMLVLGAVLALTLATNVILTGQQKERLRRQLSAGWGKLATLLGGD